VAGIAHSRWPASKKVGFVATIVALAIAELVEHSSTTSVAGFAHSKWPASNEVGFAPESLALCEASQAKNML